MAVKKNSNFSVLLLFILLTFSIFLGLLQNNSSKKNIVKTKAAPINPQVAQAKPQFNSTLLAKYLTAQAVLLGAADHMSYYFKDLSSDKAISQDPEKSWVPASTIKAYVVLEAFRQRRLGLISFDQIVSIDKNNVVPTAMESDEFPKLDEGTQVSVKQLVEMMIIQSDNTAFNTLLDILDRRNINNTLQTYHLTETIVGEKLSLDDNQFAIDLNVPGRQSNTTTAKDLSTFYDILYNKKVPDTEEMLSIFKRQKFKDMIPAQIPEDTQVAHKTGEWDPYYHDGGIIYKNGSPFIFVAFSNNGTPEVVAEEARVAYYQSANYVGAGNQQALINQSKRVTEEIKRPVYYLSEIPPLTNILGASTTKFPALTAQDLGITSSDFGINPQFSKAIKGAFITEKSPLFFFKNLYETARLNLASNKAQKTKVYLDITRDRLSQIKTLLKNQDLSGAQEILNESETYLKKSASLTSASSDPTTAVEIKQLSDMRFSLLAGSSQQLPSTQKEQFVDNVYNFYQKYKTSLAPYVQNSTIANPMVQKPVIATVVSTNNNTATIRLGDGSTKQMPLNDATPLRNFQSSSVQNASALTPGAQIAVVGTVTQNQVIIPQFVLNNVPQELPQPKQGVVVKIDPNVKELTILNNQGKEVIVKVDQNTVLKSKDTNVSLEGITAGSQISVFGIQTPQPTPTPTAAVSITPVNPSYSPAPKLTGATSPPSKGSPSSNNPSVIPTIIVSISPIISIFSTPGTAKIPTGTVNKQTSPAINPTSAPAKTPSQPTTQPTSVIKATSVTVVNNGSGAKERTKPPSSPPPTKPNPPVNKKK